MNAASERGAILIAETTFGELEPGDVFLFRTRADGGELQRVDVLKGWAHMAYLTVHVATGLGTASFTPGGLEATKLERVYRITVMRR